MSILKIKKGDLVQIISGKEKGKSGKVLEITEDKKHVIIEGRNFVKKTVKKTQQTPKGGITTKEAPLHISNVMCIDPKSGKPGRLSVKVLEDGKKVRVFKKSGEILT